MARNLSQSLKRMVAGLCALMVVASQVIAPASSGGLFSDSSIVASAEGAQQYEVSPGQDSDAGTVIKIDDPDESGTTYTATAKNGYRFVKFVYDNEMSGEQEERYSNQIHFGEEEAYLVSNLKAVFLKVSDSTYNVTANTGLKYTGEAQDLVTTTGEGGTIKYALSNGATVYKQGETGTRKKIKKVVVGDAFCPQNGDDYGYELPAKYSKFVYGGETYDAYTNGIGITNWGGVCHITKIGTSDVNLPAGYDGVKITAIDEVNGIITFEAIKSSEYDPFAGLVWGTTAPKGTAAGDYYVCWKVEGNESCQGKDPVMVTTTIAKADFTLTGAETAYTGEALDLITGDAPAGTQFTMTEPKEDADYDEEKAKITEWVQMIEYMMYGQTSLDHDEQRFYDNASRALEYYGDAIDKLKDNNEDAAAYSINNAKEAAAEMARYDVTPSDDDVKEAIAYINTYIKNTTLAATKERFDPAEPTVWSDEIPKEIAIGEYTVYYKGDGVNYSDEIKSVTAKIISCDASVTINSKDYVVTDESGKTLIDPTTAATETTPAVYTLTNAEYTIYSNETLSTTDDRMDMSVSSKGFNFGNKAYKYRYKVELSGIDNSDDVSDEITIFHAHEIAVTRSEAKDQVIADCTGENDDYPQQPEPVRSGC